METRHTSPRHVPFNAKRLRYFWAPANGTRRGDGHGIAVDHENPKGIMRVDKCVNNNPSSLWEFNVFCDGKKVESGYRASQVEAINTAERIYHLHVTKT